jgi:alpha-L-rhamnosidase
MMFYSLSCNFDVKTLLSKVVMDAFDSQGTSGYVPSTVPHFMNVYDDDLNWGGAAITIPWRNYKQYGDKSLMLRYYDRMKRLITYYGTLANGGIIRNDYSVLSDWGQETSGLTNHTSSSFTLTCTYYYLLEVMA